MISQHGECLRRAISYRRPVAPGQARIRAAVTGIGPEFPW